ncbi:hypothetical protein M271_24090 [Streptomyces rapamycinicus NRRL 5491]|nr:hypothetical protein M271_24090 [Streptomyces rapamycinicus NRRL 5491]
MADIRKQTLRLGKVSQGVGDPVRLFARQLRSAATQ